MKLGFESRQFSWARDETNTGPNGDRTNRPSISHESIDQSDNNLQTMRWS